MRLKNVIIPAILFIFLINFAVADYWTSYGYSYTPMWHWNPTGYGNFDLGVNQSSISTGLELGSIPSFPYEEYPNYLLQHSINPEPLVWDFETGTNYMIIPQGSYIQVYNDDLYLIEEISTGEVTSQIDLVDFSGLGDINEVAGVFEYNDTRLQFKTYRYNYTSVQFTQTYSYDIDVDSVYSVGGVRCQTGECYFTIYESSTGDTKFYWVNTTDLTSYTFSGFLAPIEPLAWLDIDGDGQTEFMMYNNESIKVFEKDGSVDITLSPTGSNQFHQVVMFHNDATNDWRYATIEMQTSLSYSPSLYAYVYKADGSSMWNKILVNQTYPVDWGAGSYWTTGRIGIVSDYGGFGNDDGYPDVYIASIKNRRGASPSIAYAYRVYQGYTGAEFFGWNKYENGTSADREAIALTLADLNNDGYDEFILKSGVNWTTYDDSMLYIFDVASAGYLHTANIKYASGCVPADLDFDGFLDIVCSGDGGTTFLSSGGTNQNSQIVSVAYSPSISVQVGETLSALVTASDNEGDTIYYREKCSNSDSWGSPDTNSTRQCIYGSVGTYNMSVAVKDLYHTNYNIFSQDIVVTETGTICDNDGICESEQGETYYNCGDCPAPNTTTSSVEGSMTLPTELVDVSNTNQGLLPEIYYGTLGFMSSVLSPLIVLIFVILFVMIMITIGVIIKKIAIRVGS